MAILTRTKLSSITESRLGYSTFSSVLNESKSERKQFSETSVFLSHSHTDLDNQTIKQAIVFLRKRGVRIYIDSEDVTLSPFTNAETARQIKNRIKENQKFILLATNNAINSKWCNWELGYGDAMKYINNIALFPISENSGAWTGSEYLSIYPRIEDSIFADDYYKVIYPDGTSFELSNWLKSK